MSNRNNFVFYAVLTIASVLVGAAAGLLFYTAWDLPQIQTLEEYKPSITSRVYSGSNRLLAEFFTENRTPVALSDIPETMIQALIATEDSRFYLHHGLDVRGIARAFYRNIRAKKVLEGGSTLTQQLSKILFLTPERSYTRKLKEMILALRIEQQYTKQEILTFYLNQIYFGSGAYGIEAAARIYFNKNARDLTLPECALLAGLPRSPTHYSPFKTPSAALSRRAYVLNRMVAAKVISPAQANEAMQAPLPVQAARRQTGFAPYFVEYVRQKVEERLGSSILYSGGLNIYTTLNDELQVYAEQAVRSGLAQVEARHAKKGNSSLPLQAAMLVLDPATGQILAMVGGRDYGQSQFNRSWQALRQPGSAFKPLIYAVALERGFTAADLLDDSPYTMKIDRKRSWTPENFSRTYQGPVTLRKALAQSLNIPTIRLLQKIGIQETIHYSQKFGIRSPLNPYLSLALGSSDVTLFELTSAYSVFANHGLRLEPVSVLLVTDSTGKVIYANDSAPEQVIKPETAFLVTNLLKGVIEHGTGWKARELGIPAAGKTGTTNDYRDSWFIGYTPSLVAGVWVGYDDHRTIGPRETGARAALPLWLEFMKSASAGKDRRDFSVPENIVFRDIDPLSGLLKAEQCKQTIREAFIAGTEPHRYCDESVAGSEDTVMQDEAPQ